MKDVAESDFEGGCCRCVELGGMVEMDKFGY